MEDKFSEWERARVLNKTFSKSFFDSNDIILSSDLKNMTAITEKC